MTLDEIKIKIELLDAEAIKLKTEMSPLSRRLCEVADEKKELLLRVEELRKHPRVRDHAVIRYLERKHGFNFETQRSELLDQNTIAAINAGAQKIKRDGVQLIIKDKTVVTVI